MSFILHDFYAETWNFNDSYQVQKCIKRNHKNTMSDSGSSVELDEEVFEVERIEGKRIRYGGVSVIFIQKFI